MAERKQQALIHRAFVVLLLAALSWFLIFFYPTGASRNHVFMFQTQGACAAPSMPGGHALPHPIPPQEVPPGCLHLENVCVDQQVFVMMGSRYNVASSAPELHPLPQYSSRLPYVPPITDSSEDAWVSIVVEPWSSAAHEEVHQRSSRPFFSVQNPPDLPMLPDLVFRPKYALEPTNDLRHPEFEQGTVPLVFHATLQNYYGESAM